MSSPGNRSVLISGASSGLGAQLARTFAEEGYCVGLMARRETRLNEVAEACREEGAPEAFVHPGDVTDRSACREFVAEAGDRWDGPDVVVANAGRSMWAPFHDVEDPDRYRSMFEVNYNGVVNLAHACLPFLREQGGSLVAVASIQARLGVPKHTFYAASKHAVDGFFRSLRTELEEVHVMTVYPHWIRGTELRSQALREEDRPDRAGEPGEGVSVERCARALYEGVQRRTREVFVPGYLRWVGWLYALVPSLVEGFIKRRVRNEETK